MVRPLKNKQIPHLQEAIKETAWRQIAEFGASALSLRAIARELRSAPRPSITTSRTGTRLSRHSSSTLTSLLAIRSWKRAMLFLKAK